MSQLNRNILYNYIAQFYVASIGILMLPQYLKYMGAEAYGLIGFFTLLSSWMQLLDLGISPTLGREVARLKNSQSHAVQLRTVVRSLEVLFFLIAALSALSIFLARHWLAQEWLTIHSLDLGLVARCIGLMAMMIGLRWIGSLHRSGINAYEAQVWLSMFEVVFATLRTPVSLLLVIWSHGNLLLFFGYQLLLTLIEQSIISIKFYSLLHRTSNPIPWFSMIEVKRIAPFALSVAYTGSIWIFITQLDKLLLSKVLPLAEYGYFCLIAAISGGVMILSGPISKAIQPRMAALLAQDKEAEMLLLYRKSTRLVVCMVAPVTLVLAFFPKEIVYIWTGNEAAADWTAPILPLFIVGNGLLAIGAFQYYLQFAHGKLRQHVLYNTASALLLIPLVFYAVINHGPIGAAWVWLGFRLFGLLVWTPYVHHLLAPGIHKFWLLKDVLPPLATSMALLAITLHVFMPHFPHDRLQGLMAIVLIVIFTTVTALFTAFPTLIRGQFRASI